MKSLHDLSSRPAALVAVVATLTAWACAGMPVFSQEAYYWTYAQHPALSYFDHPPMVAWLIWIGTSLFGDGSVGIRSGTWLCGVGTTCCCALLLRDFGLDRRAQCLGVVATLTLPLLAMTHFLANPDAPLMCFWTLTVYALWRARAGLLRWWLVAGFAAGAALLSKYSAAFLAVGGTALLLLDPQMRRQLKRPGPYLAVVLAVCVFLPVLTWNVLNNFESFRFQTEDRYAKATLNLPSFAATVLEQIGIFHPFAALLLPAAMLWLARRWRADARALWLFAFGLPLPAYLLLSALWIQVKINWFAPAYVALALVVIIWWSEARPAWTAKRPWRLARWSLLCVPLAMALTPLLRLVPSSRGSSWIGWDEVAERAEFWEDQIDAQDGIEGNVFFFSADYRDSAQLGRSLTRLWAKEGEHHSPTGVSDGHEPTLAQNVLGLRALQFDHWTSPKSRIGQHAIFVLPRPAGREEMVQKAADRFKDIKKVEHVYVVRFGITLFDAAIYACYTYLGPDGQ